MEEDLARLVARSGRDVVMAPALYHLRHGSDLWQQIERLDRPVALAGWINPRSLRCLMSEYAGREPLVAVDLSRVEGPEEAFAALAEALPAGDGEGTVRELAADVSERWYPVIDRSRCTSCGHCMQFCIFGVYEIEERRVVAVQPDNCKPGCPACARVCPEGAIVFPLSNEPAIAGEPGCEMEPDAAARRMYYVRTGKPCPVCGHVAEAGGVSDIPPGVPTCDECGRPLAEASADPSPVHEEIDSLIDALDDLAAGGGSE